MRTLMTATAAWLLTSAVGATPAENNAAMLKLATDRGCMACHTLQPAAPRADGLPPIAPAWRDVSIKYRNDPRAHDTLTRTVLDGSNPAGRHWVGKVSPANMPPQAGTVSADEARRLVNWLLVLVP
ncbi:c-type cytochrome [Ideonella sp. 4Y11]|uniref:C-type cytochrome n=1 Tax=Ideonella aquatica TaxID=2824119 RepID=A0A941BGJ1_9BURK|nr:c-type cytochrome [Ideonella aquatica]MBQ0959876.1 c-type cytochrome [Ideonella aquatica]